MNLLEQMNSDLGIDIQYIKFCSKRNDLYAQYYIPKKNGKLRKILQPSKELKVLQYWLGKNIFKFFPISKYSTAYQKGCSVKKNADYHKECNYVLHTDIVHFFESITRETMTCFFQKNRIIVDELQLSSEEIDLIMDLVLYKGNNLVVGSVASPIISNCVMYEFDIKMSKLLESKKMNYTRYADDIVISSNQFIDVSIIEDIDYLLKEYGFKRNTGKTYFMSKHKKREITGVVIDNNNNSLSIGTKKYSRLKQDIYNYLVKNKGSVSEIKGMLSYLKDINIDRYKALEKIYIKYDKKNELFNR